MPRDGSGNYTYPPGTPGIPDTSIESAKYNGYIADIQQDLNIPRPIVAGGTGSNTAAGARDNLDAERAAQIVTNYDTHLWESGSFVSGGGASAAPVAANFSGHCVILNPDMSHITLEARNNADGTLYIRRKVAGVWSAWQSQADLTTQLHTMPTYGAIATSVSNSGSIMVNAGPAAGDAAYMSFHRPGSLGIQFGLDTDNQLKIGGNSWGAAYRIVHEGLSSPILSTLTVSGALSAGGITATGVINSVPTTSSIASSNLNGSIIVSSNTAPDAAYITFLRQGIYGIEVGLDTDNTLRIGGGSLAGLAYRIVHEGLPNPTLTGNLSASGAISAVQYMTAQDIYLSNGAAGASGVVNLRNAAATQMGSIFFSANNFYIRSTVSTADLVLNTSGILHAGNGVLCRVGLSGGYRANAFNIDFVGGLAGLYIDNTSMGNFAYTSDYRIKKDVVDLPSTWETVKALRPIKYTQAEYTPQIEKAYALKQAAAVRERAEKGGVEPKPVEELGPMFPADDIERWGFIAHELQETLIDSAATGVKDAPDVVQSPNPFTLIAALTKALQEAMARIEALEAAQAAP